MSPVRIPLPPDGASIGYPRWLVYEHDSGSVVGKFSARHVDQRQARVLARNLATYYRRQLALVKENHAAARLNPFTLVHGCQARTARYHLLSGRGVPLADLYVGEREAKVAAQAFATMYGEPVQLTTHIPGRELRREPSQRIAGRRTNPSGRNPRGAMLQFPARGVPRPASAAALERLRDQLDDAHATEYRKQYPGSPVEPDPVTLKERRDFYALDIGGSGAFMVRKADGAIFGIRGYGSPDYRKGIAYLGELTGYELLRWRWARGPFRVDMKQPLAGNPSRSLKAKIARSYRRLERSRKQRRAGARYRAGKASFAQLGHELERHDIRRLRQTGSSQARAYRSAQPPGYGERGRPASWNPRRAANPSERVRVFGDKYELERGEPYRGPIQGVVEQFLAYGKRGAVYGGLVWSDGRFHWMNALRPGGTVPFDLAQVSPLELWDAAAGRQPNPKRRNPSSAHQRAARTFAMWHEFPHGKVSRVTVPFTRMPRHLVRLGEVVRIDYRSNKWEGKNRTYTHATKRPRPILVTDPDARTVNLVGGAMRPTADGLVN